jgi:hypothetical protein
LRETSNHNSLWWDPFIYFSIDEGAQIGNGFEDSLLIQVLVFIVKGGIGGGIGASPYGKRGERIWLEPL